MYPAVTILRNNLGYVKSDNPLYLGELNRKQVSYSLVDWQSKSKVSYVYCQYSNANELRVHKKMYNEVTNFMSGVGETSAVIRGLGNLLFNSEQKYNTPFRYCEKKGW